jgi:integrase
MPNRGLRTRRNGQGSFTRLSDYRVRVDLTVTGADGARRRKSKVVRGDRSRWPTQDALDAALADLRDRYPDGQEVSPAETVGQYVERWHAELLPMTGADPSTIANYRPFVRWHIVPDIGDIPLSELTAREVNDWLQSLVRSADAGGKGLSQSSARIARTVLKQALDAAIIDGKVTMNVALQVRAPSGPVNTRRAMNADEVRSFLSAAEGTRLEAAFIVAAELAPRPGEILALSWDDINLDGGTLSITHAQRRNGGDLVARGATKTPSAVRTLALPDAVRTALKAHLERQEAQQASAGDRWNDPYGLVFTTATGSPIRPETYRREFLKVLGAAGLEGFVPYELRHTAVSHLSTAGVRAEDIADVAGHADGGVLIRSVYRHQTNPVLTAHLLARS